MKNIIIITITLFVCNIITAQVDHYKDKTKVDIVYPFISYNVHFDDYSEGKQLAGTYTIGSTKNKKMNATIYDKNGKAPIDNIDFSWGAKLVDKNAVINLMKSTFSVSEIGKFQTNEDFLQVNTIVDFKGNILEVEFRFRYDDAYMKTIPPKRFYTLESNLKSNVKFSINNEIYEFLNSDQHIKIRINIGFHKNGIVVHAE